MNLITPVELLITPAELLAWTRGEVVRGEPVACAGLYTDTRTPLRGGLFLALTGERFDGHDFLLQAAAQGAAGAVIAAAKTEAALGSLDRDRSSFFLLAVPDTLTALQDIARGQRRKFTGPLIAVTGSNGKTTTKVMAATAVAAQKKVLAAEHNFNNDIGLPLTLLKLTPEHECCVVEMGMRGLGQIARLAAVAEPTIGGGTNVGPGDLELLGSLERVATAKAELVASLPPGGTAVLNGDDPLVKAMATQSRAEVVYYGLEEEGDSDGETWHLSARKPEFFAAGTSFELCRHGRPLCRVKLRLPGKHNIYNALAALGAAQAAGIPLEDGAAALANLTALPMRLETTELPGGTILINDAYNASPLSMEAALAYLKSLAGSVASSGRKVAVLGDMLELGAFSANMHQKVGELAAQAGLDVLVTVGEGGRQIARGALAAGFTGRVVSYPDAAAAARDVAGWHEPGDLVLIKASRGIKLEQAASAVTKRG